MDAQIFKGAAIGGLTFRKEMIGACGSTDFALDFFSHALAEVLGKLETPGNVMSARRLYEEIDEYLVRMWCGAARPVFSLLCHAGMVR